MLIYIRYLADKEIFLGGNKKIINNDSECKIYCYDKIIYLKDGVLHNEKGPAYINIEGEMRWYINGELHRINKPAVINKNTKHEEWFLNGVRHNINGPAINDAYGNKFWYFNGVLHRENRPAIEYFDGRKKYYNNGKPYKK